MRAAGAGELLAQAERGGAALSGRVYLVGAGPGDPGLLTARALELIAAADTILYDRLIPPAALEGARPDAELLYVGKEGGGASVPQEQTEALLVERGARGTHGRAPEGRRPVRVRPRRRGGARAARRRHRLRGRARRDGRRGRARLRRDPGHAPRPGARLSRSSPGARATRASSTGRRWRRSRARSSSTWASGAWRRSRRR